MEYEETRQNKTFDTKQPKTQKNNIDSKTVDVSLFRRIRKHDDRLTVRINKRFKELIKRHCVAKGLSICHINDALWFGYLLGWNEKLDVDVKSPTINLTLVRDVKRVRRYAVEEVKEETEVCEVSGVEGSKDECAVCGKSSFVRVIRKDGSRAFLCRPHFQREKRGLRGWAYVRELFPYG